MAYHETFWVAVAAAAPVIALAYVVTVERTFAQMDKASRARRLARARIAARPGDRRFTAYDRGVMVATAAVTYVLLLAATAALIDAMRTALTSLRVGHDRHSASFAENELIWTVGGLILQAACFFMATRAEGKLRGDDDF